MVTAEPSGDAQTEAMSAMLFPMLFLIGMMVLLMFFLASEMHYQMVQEL